MGFLTKYRELRLKESADLEDEVEYNFGRAFNQLGKKVMYPWIEGILHPLNVFRTFDSCRKTLRTCVGNSKKKTGIRCRGNTILS